MPHPSFTPAERHRHTEKARRARLEARARDRRRHWSAEDEEAAGHAADLEGERQSFEEA
jgi:hypothetical protein